MNILIEDYYNVLDDIKLTSKDIESQLREINLFFDKFIDVEVENDNKLPPVITYFYDFVKTNNKIPKQFDLWKEYKKNVYVSQIIKNPIKNEALKSRIFRIYPSLVRDIHFAILLKEKSKNCTVIYNNELDFFIGIDILISYKDKLYGINLYVNTERAKLYRGKKYNRHSKTDNVISIDIPVNFEDSYRVKDFYLYGKKEIELIKNKLIS